MPKFEAEIHRTDTIYLQGTVEIEAVDLAAAEKKAEAIAAECNRSPGDDVDPVELTEVDSACGPTHVELVKAKE